MNIVLDLRCVHPGMSGIGRYALNLCKSIESCAEPVQLQALTTAPAADFVRGLLSVPLIPVPADPAWDHLGLPQLLRERRTGIFHSPLFQLPSITVCDYLCTIHDVIPIARPDLTHPSFRAYFHSSLPAALRRSRRIVTVSQHSREDITRHLRVDPSQVTFIYETVNPCFGPKPAEDVRSELSKLGIATEFLLYVGALDRRKNLPRLLQAYRSLGPSPLLVIVGGPSGDGYDIESDIRQLGLTGMVRVLGRVPDETLAHLYAGAMLFVFPSLYEGFGLPVVEAMASGAPVLTSRTTSLGEIAAGAAHLVDPESVEEIRHALADLITRPDLRERYRKQGLARAAEFSLERQGRTILELYRAVSSRAA